MAPDRHIELIAALENLRRPLFVLDGEQRCLFANPAFYRAVGAPLDSELLVARFCPEVLSWPTSLETGTASLFREDGSADSVALSTVPLGDGLRLFEVIETSADFANVVDLHAQRLETLGMLAGGVAHDFNNVLTGILGHVSYLKTILPRNGQHSESIAAIEEGARRASSMTQQILNFSKLDHGERPVAIDVDELVQNTCRLLRGAVPHDRVFECEVNSGPCCVLGVEGKIAQILINLVMNARDATESGGMIKVCVATVNESEELAAAFHGRDLSSSEYARISVIDDGHGMSEEVRRRLFEPYFSTKGGKGTGLGMATVQRIVVLFGGAITVESAVRQGTCISVYLPITQTSGSADRFQEFEPAAREAIPGRILIVDDEYPVRNVLCMSLEHLGYDVEVASSGEEAIAKYEASGGFDLVLLDMIMLNLSGDQVFRRLQEMDPGVRVLVMSGYTSEASVQGVLDSGGLDFMPKPFTIEELARKVRDCLDSPR